MPDDQIRKTVHGGHLKIQRPVFFILKQGLEPAQGTVIDIAIITGKGEKDQGRHCQIAPHRVSRAFIHVFGDVTGFLECAELLLIGSLVALNLQFLHRGLQLDIVLTLLKNKVGQPPLGRTSCDEQD